MMSMQIRAINSEADYLRIRHALDELVDEAGSDESHPQAALMDRLARLVYAWEEQHHPIAKASQREVLAHMMEEHGLKRGPET
jgi:HTH-type transcriptional regulator/antitoxin HigA